MTQWSYLKRLTVMKVKKGKKETWELAKKGGLDEGIAKIAKYFDIKDVCVIVGDEMAYVEEKPRRVHRVPAIPTTIDYKEVINKTKEQKKYYK
ncbi:hypothetical protein MISHU_38 [Escherichia phage vB_EcoD_Mishu]|uniref:Uncharacterized protein n=4 Tax=Tlsvirus TaxID=1920865 RepID=A0AAE9CD68_9CAUD|nr:hypothetical protein MISHU_38 [Escherichia phage vB_EcoD_Mishu]UGO53552.1 hypothetical protein DEVORATOR_36 [Citrobacter phage_vB_CfrD_Devorator]